MKHDLIKTGDLDAFPSILDRNNEVALSYCRRCKKGEGELDIECFSKTEVLECCNCLNTRSNCKILVSIGNPLKPLPYYICDKCIELMYELVHASIENPLDLAMDLEKASSLKDK